jgi:hypothetical protein
MREFFSLSPNFERTSGYLDTADFLQLNFFSFDGEGFSLFVFVFFSTAAISFSHSQPNVRSIDLFKRSNPSPSSSKEKSLQDWNQMDFAFLNYYKIVLFPLSEQKHIRS